MKGIAARAAFHAPLRFTPMNLVPLRIVGRDGGAVALDAGADNERIDPPEGFARF